MLLFNGSPWGPKSSRAMRANTNALVGICIAHGCEVTGASAAREFVREVTATYGREARYMGKIAYRSQRWR